MRELQWRLAFSWGSPGNPFVGSVGQQQLLSALAAQPATPGTPCIGNPCEPSVPGVVWQQLTWWNGITYGMVSLPGSGTWAIYEWGLGAPGPVQPLPARPVPVRAFAGVGAATATSLVAGEQYALTGPNAGAPTSVADAQAGINAIWPGSATVVSVTPGPTTTTVVFNWTGATLPITAAMLTSGTTLTDLGPTPAPAAPAAASSWGPTIAIGLGVLAVGALAWYASTRVNHGYGARQQIRG
jgi:hypothetical protein